jgi:hypothetical protein
VTAPRQGDVVVIRAFDDVPEHLFRIDSVEDDCVTGFALTGPLAGSYGEPPIEMILRVHEREK